MFFNVSAFLSLFIILATTPSTLSAHAESLSSTTDAVEISTRATSGSESNVTKDSSEQEWRSNESTQQNRPPVEKVVSIDASSLHKYRRDGIENLPEHDYRRRYFLDFPERYQYENDLYHRGDKNRQQQQYQQQQYQQPQYQQPQYQQPQYQQPQYQQPQYQQPQYHQQQYQQPQYHQQQYQHQYQHHRNRDEIYPATVQGCPMRDEARPYAGPNMQFQNQGMLQGWLAGGGWRGSPGDEKHYESSYPLQVTTATPKIAPSYRNRDYTRHDFDHYDKSAAPYKPRYDAEAGVSATRDYDDSPIREIERNPPTWMQPYQQHQQQHQHQNRNNRIVYYEYNLDNRRPASGRMVDSRVTEVPICHPMDRNCGSTSGAQHDNRWSSAAGSSGHGSRFDNAHRFQTSDEYHYRNQQQPSYSRSKGAGRNEDSNQSHLYDYLDEDHSYRYRDDGRGGGGQNAGIGYVYSIDLAMERAISPSTAYAYDMGFARKNQGYRHAPMPHLDTRT